MMMNEKAAAGVASADDSRRDQARQQDLPEIEYTMTKAVVQVVAPFLLGELRRFLFTTRPKASSLWRATISAREELKRRVMEVQEDGET